MHTLCARFIAGRFVVAIVAIKLPCVWRARALLHNAACVSNADVSDASVAIVHTSKLPPRGSVVLNTTTQRAQPQATSGDQSDGSSDTSASRVQVINSE